MSVSKKDTWYLIRYNNAHDLYVTPTYGIKRIMHAAMFMSYEAASNFLLETEEKHKQRLIYNGGISIVKQHYIDIRLDELKTWITDEKATL